MSTKARRPYFDITARQLAKALRSAGISVKGIEDADEDTDACVVLDEKYNVQVADGVVCLNWWENENTDDATMMSLHCYDLEQLVVAIRDPQAAYAKALQK